MAINAAVMGGILAWFRRTGRAVPTLTVMDVGVTALATHRVARLLTKDTVTSPIRAPFTRFEGPGGPSEVNERVRGRG